MSSLRDDLVLIGWLSKLAPESVLHPEAGRCATAAVRALFPSEDSLDDALANALRRSLATVLVEQPRWVLHQPEVLNDRARFRFALDHTEPAIVALQTLVGSFPALTVDAARIAALLVPTFRVQARDILPHDDRAGLLAAVAALSALLTVAPGSAQIGRELASLHQRLGNTAQASELRGPDDAQSTLDHADHAAAMGDMARAKELLARAQMLFARSGMLAGMAAVKRREAALLGPAERMPALFEALALSRDARDDHRGQVEGLEDLSRAFSEQGRIGPAVAALGRMARLHRGAGEALGEARALQLSGRLLCEASGPARDAGAGMVMLLWAADIGGSQDPVLADLTRRYIEGFQYTLSDVEFSSIEAIFERPREQVVNEAYALYEHRHKEELP